MKTHLALLAALAAGLLWAGLPEERARGAYRFDTPAKAWSAALPIGNGRLGALLFGDPEAETVVVNETSVWAPRREWPVNPEGPALLKAIRALLFADKRDEAEALAQGRFLLRAPRAVAPYQPLCFLRLAFAPTEAPLSDYARGVRLDEGVAWATYKRGGVTFTREAFAAYDDDILALTLAADKPGALSLTLTPTRPEGTLRAEPAGAGRLRLVGSTGKGGVRFEALLEVRAEGGTVTTEGGALRVAGATRVEARLAAATDYNRKNPARPLPDDLRARCAATLDRLAAKDAPALRADHAKAFAARYGRVALDLPYAPTGESLEARVARVRAERRLDTETLLLLHDFCRYLLLSSSRPGGAWLLQDALAPWRWTRDDALLRRLLPLLRQQTRFFLSWLTEDPRTGRLVSGPAASPENWYRTPKGRAAIDMGPACDQELIHATLTDFLAAARALTPDDPLIPRAQAALGRLALPQIGPDGRLLEWSAPLPETEPGHRHISHAYGLIPGRRITLAATPALAAALGKTLEGRLAHDYHVTGWSLGLVAGIHARLRHGDAALAAIDAASTHFCPNLFTLTTGHPQVSDMNGAPAALCDCLLRTEDGAILILPALPKRLAPKGAFRGFRAEPGLLVDAAWEQGRLTALTVTALRDGDFHLRLPDRTLTLSLTQGERRTLP